MKRRIVFGCLFLAIVVLALILVPIMNKPTPTDPIAEEPTDPIIPADPDPVESDPVEPIDPELIDPLLLNPVGFIKSGPIKIKKAESVDLKGIPGIGSFDTVVLLEAPEDTEVVLKVERLMVAGGSDGGTGEEQIGVSHSKVTLRVYGIAMTDELDKLFAPRIFQPGEKPSLSDFIKSVEAGTTLGRVGAPLKNNWGEGVNLVIIITSKDDNVVNSIISDLEAECR